MSIFGFENPDVDSLYLDDFNIL